MKLLQAEVRSWCSAQLQSLQGESEKGQAKREVFVFLVAAFYLLVYMEFMVLFLSGSWN
jgi:hypothetical protein